MFLLNAYRLLPLPFLLHPPSLYGSIFYIRYIALELQDFLIGLRLHKTNLKNIRCLLDSCTLLAVIYTFSSWSLKSSALVLLMSK